MPRQHVLKEKIEIIEQFFEKLPAKSFTLHKLTSYLEKAKISWGLSYRHTEKYIINYLLKMGKLTMTEFEGDNLRREVYSWETKDEFTIISGLKSNSYYMYYSALFLHGLTLQIPKTYYLNSEHYSNQKIRTPAGNSLTQEGIDYAFSSEQRKSAEIFTLREKKIIITNSKNTGELGVIRLKKDSQDFLYTDLERTLIDIVVRPAYSGGVLEILDAYKKARSKVKIKKMEVYLRKLDYIYPYHQAVGFYLEKAGYTEEEIQLFDKPKFFDFYLTYNIRNKAYSERWKLFYPKGL